MSIMVVEVKLVSAADYPCGLPCSHYLHHDRHARVLIEALLCCVGLL